MLTSSAVGVAAVILIPAAVIQEKDFGEAGTEITSAPKPAGSDKLFDAPGDMRATLEAQVEKALGTVVTDAPIEFAPLDDQLKVLPAGSVASASSAYLDFGTKASGRSWRIFVAERSDSDGSQLSCEGVQVALSCEVIRTPNGVARRVVSITQEDPGRPDNYRFVTDTESLDAGDLATVRLESDVRFIGPDGSQTSAIETVYGPSTLTDEAFLSTPEDLAQLATDPALRW